MRDVCDSDLVRNRRGETRGDTLDRRRGALESRLRTLDPTLRTVAGIEGGPPMSKSGGKAQTSDLDYLLTI